MLLSSRVIRKEKEFILAIQTSISYYLVLFINILNYKKSYILYPYLFGILIYAEIIWVFGVI